MQRFAALVLTVSLAIPGTAGALYHQAGTPGRSESAPGRARALAASPSPAAEVSPSPEASPRGRLRKAEHAARLVRVQGVVNGLTNKLTNLSERLDQHLVNFDQRIEALTGAGHALTVDAELAAARAEVAETQALITKLIADLKLIPDSETPRTALRSIRTQLRDLRKQLRDVRAAFQDLREAIRDDVRAGRPSPTASPAAEEALSPSPVATPTP